MSERKSLPLGERWDAEDAMVLRIAAERGVSPFEVMFNFAPAPSRLPGQGAPSAVSEAKSTDKTVPALP